MRSQINGGKLLVNKGKWILVIYDLLKNEQPVDLKYLCAILKCSERTVFRYLADIKDYLKQFKDQDLVFDRAKNSFVICVKS